MSPTTAGKTAGPSRGKPRPLSKSYLKFENVVNRSLNLLSLQSTLEGWQAAESTKLDLSDLTRSAIVLAVAAMDAYFTDVFAERLVRYLKRHGPNNDLIELLQSGGFNIRTALELLAMDRPYRRLRSLMAARLERHTAQKVEDIDQLFLAYGLKDFCHNVERMAKRKNLLGRIRGFVERRHAIVHDGDANTFGKLRGVDHREARRRVCDVVTFVGTAEALLSKALG